MDAILEQVKPETATMIANLAQARGQSVDNFLRSLLPLADIPNGTARPLYETATPEELAQAYLDWANSHSRNSPGLTLEDVSRETIYEER
jgi:hypothetical protein